MKNLWNKTFTATQDKNAPNEIIEEQCAILKQLTGGKIIGKVSSYAGPISSYISSSGFAVIANFMGKQEKIDIQEDLGNVSESFTFEFFITSTKTPNYKYRVLFLRYEIPYYPVRIVLDEAIAKELEVASAFICESQINFEGVLGRIFNAKKLESIISTLLAIVQKEETPLIVQTDEPLQITTSDS
jgi:hypothetical protein